MSEQSHSPQEQLSPPSPSHAAATLPVPTPGKRSWGGLIAGTIGLFVIAGLGFQFFTANPAASQTDATSAGQAGLNSSASGKVLARVNDQAITYDVVARECVARHGEEILDNLINRLIIQQECERQGILVSRQDVEEEISETAKKFNLPVDTWYQMLASERGLTREQYQNDIIWPMIALKKLAGQQVQVTEKEMQEGFERDYGPRVKARMILLEGNIRQANRIWEQCVATPDDFDRLAREHSADPNSRPLGGVVPPIRRHAGNKAIEEAAFKLHTGEISGLIQVAENSYVILKSEGLTEPVVEDVRVVWNDLLEQLTEEKTQRTVATIFEQIKSEARVDNFLTRTSTGGKNPVKQTSALRSAQQGSGTLTR